MLHGLDRLDDRSAEIDLYVGFGVRHNGSRHGISFPFMGYQLPIVREAEIESFLKRFRVVRDSISNTTESLRGYYLINRWDIIRRQQCEPCGKQ